MSDELLNGFTVGPFRVLPRQNSLEGPNGTRHVEPKAMAVLLALAARPGRLVTRDELLTEVWGDVVVLDESLTKAIQVLRSHFGDTPGHPRVIRTVPRKGYELIAPVGNVTAEAAIPKPTPLVLAQPSVAAAPETSPPTRWLPKWRIAMALLLAALLASGIFHLSSRSPHELVTIAVIPPVTLGPDDDLGFVAAGLADYLIDQLSGTPHLEVVARRASFGMRDTETNVRAIGEQLGARYLVEGSLRELPDGLMLTLFLVDTVAGTNVWTSRLHGDADAVARLEQRSAELVRSALADRLGIAVRQTALPRSAIEDHANRKFLEAQYQWSLRGERRIGRSIELLEEALAIAPDYAAAHLALAQSIAVRPFYSNMPVASQFERARASLARALALDATLESEVAALEGFMQFKEHRWSEADASLRHSLVLAPDNVNALYWYSWFLSQLGRYQEALSHLLIAQRLDPVSAVLNDRLAIAYLWTNDLENAAERHRVAMELGYLESTQPLGAMMFLYRSGEFDALGSLLERLGGDPTWIEPTVDALAHADRREAASAFIDSLTQPDPVLDMVRFGIWLLFGQTDRAFRDFDPGPHSPYIEALWSREAEHLRADARFEDLLRRLGFTGADRALLAEY